MAGLLLPLEGLDGVRMHAVNVECFCVYLMLQHLHRPRCRRRGRAAIAVLRTVASVCIIYNGFIA